MNRHNPTSRTRHGSLRKFALAACSALLMVGSMVPTVARAAEYTGVSMTQLNTLIGTNPTVQPNDIITLDPTGIFSGNYTITVPGVTIRFPEGTVAANTNSTLNFTIAANATGVKLINIKANTITANAPITLTGSTLTGSTPVGDIVLAQLTLGANALNSTITGNTFKRPSTGDTYFNYVLSMSPLPNNTLADVMLHNTYISHTNTSTLPVYINSRDAYGYAFTHVFSAEQVLTDNTSIISETIASMEGFGVTPGMYGGRSTIDLLVDRFGLFGSKDIDFGLVGFNEDELDAALARLKAINPNISIEAIATKPAPAPTKPEPEKKPELQQAPPKAYDILTPDELIAKINRGASGYTITRFDIIPAYEHPDTASPVIASFGFGETVRAAMSETAPEGWVAIELPGGRIAYMQTSALDR